MISWNPPWVFTSCGATVRPSCMSVKSIDIYGGWSLSLTIWYQHTQPCYSPFWKALRTRSATSWPNSWGMLPLRSTSTPFVLICSSLFITWSFSLSLSLFPRFWKAFNQMLKTFLAAGCTSCVMTASKPPSVPSPLSLYNSAVGDTTLLM